MNFFFRVDSENTTIGTGHVIRCLNLAKELKSKNNNIYFICRKFNGHLGKIIKKNFKVFFLKNKNIKKLIKKNIYIKKIQIEEAQKTIKIVKNKKKNILIVDHYFLNNIYEKHISKYFLKTIVIDDLTNRKHYCDLIINQNLTKNLNKKYKLKITQKKCDLLLGPKYALINKKFIKVKKKKLNKKNYLSNILLFMGGSDPGNETLKALKGINRSKIKFKKINIVLGKNFKFLKSIEEEITKINSFCKIYIQTNKMYKLMSNASIGIISCGTALLEKCVIGLPSLGTIKSKNQMPNAKILNDMGVHILVGSSNFISSNNYTKEINKLNFKKLNKMFLNSKKIYDGKGLIRINKKILQICS